MTEGWMDELYSDPELIILLEHLRNENIDLMDKDHLSLGIETLIDIEQD